MLPTAPIRQTVNRKCPKCGDKFENPLALARVCYSCWLGEQIPNPKLYEIKECYFRYDSVTEIRNAIATPRTENAFLDEYKFHFYEINPKIFKPSKLLHLALIERQMGLDNDEYPEPT